MKLNKNYVSALKEQYPTTMTASDVRSILRISKRKCAWMLQNGYIECEIAGKQRHRYIVQTDDLIVYLEKVAKNDPSVRIPTGIFNGNPSKRKRLIAPQFVHKKPPIEFQKWLSKKWSRKSQMLNLPAISTITGYGKKAVRDWIDRGVLQSVIIRDYLYVSKDWLIKFYCEEAYKIQNKCNPHILLMMKFYEKNDTAN